MEITIDLDDDLVAKAQEYTGIRDLTELIEKALRELIDREAARRLVGSHE